MLYLKLFLYLCIIYFNQPFSILPTCRILFILSFNGSKYVIQLPDWLHIAHKSALCVGDAVYSCVHCVSGRKNQTKELNNKHDSQEEITMNLFYIRTSYNIIINLFSMQMPS